MIQSESIANLAQALCKVQKERLFALTTSENPFFKSKYADLSSVWEVAREPLTDNGLCVAQTMDTSEQGEPVIVTTLLHESGEWIRGRLKIKPVKEDPQSLGSAITYGRRYSLSAILGIAQEDDDAESAMKRGDKEASGKNKPEKKAPTKPKPGVPETLTPQQKKMIEVNLKQSGLDRDVFKQALKITSINDITKARASKMLDDWAGLEKSIGEWVDKQSAKGT